MMDKEPGQELLGEVSFAVAARVAVQLGRESISNSLTAITELVKNAYDADATQVRIHFHNLGTDAAFLVLMDNGCGMSDETLRDQWLVIGTAGKKLASRSQTKGRVLTGEKGLGRLGLDRLCKMAVINTFVRDQEYGLQLVVDWSKYENFQDLLGDIRHPLYRIPKVFAHLPVIPATPTANGTIILLEGLKDEWDRASLLALKSDLSLLISPFGVESDFEIVLDSGMNWTEVDGAVSSSLVLDAAEWQLTAEITERETVRYRMVSRQYDRVYELVETAWAERFRDQKHRAPRCGPVKFEMYFFPRKPVELENIAFSKREIGEFLDLQQGVRIYRDGFRVKPYGEPSGEGDWLTLAYRRQQSPGGVTQPGWKVGYNQVVGAVFIGRERNPNLVDQTNREGLPKGPAVNDLRMFTLDAIGFFERRRSEFARQLSTNSVDETHRRALETAEAAENIKKELQDTTRVVLAYLDEARKTGDASHLAGASELLGKTTAKVAETMTEGQEVQRQLVEVGRDLQVAAERQKDTLGNLASLGILAAGFGHETIASANLVLANAQQLQQDLDGGLFMVVPDVRESVNDKLLLLVKRATDIRDFAEFTLRNVQRDKRERKAVYLDKVILTVFRYLSRSLTGRKINFDLDVPKENVRPILAFEIDWESILLNLITNAVWAIDAGEPNQRKLRVILREQGDTMELRFADSGCGITAGTERDIFLPTFSTKRAPDGTVIGTGMGLAIVKTFVEGYTGGEVSVIPRSDLGGAEFVIQVAIPQLESRGRKKG